MGGCGGRGEENSGEGASRHKRKMEGVSHSPGKLVFLSLWSKKSLSFLRFSPSVYSRFFGFSGKMKRTNNVSHLVPLVPRIPGRSLPVGNLLKGTGRGKPPGPGQQGRGHALISSYPNRGSPHVLAAAGIAGTSSLSVRKLFHSPGQKSSSSNEDWSNISSSGSPRRFGGGGLSQVTSNTPRRDQFETGDMKNSTATMKRSPRGGGDNLTAHHSPLQRKQEVSSAGVVERKRSSRPDLKRNKSPVRPKTASEKQKEWIMKYGKLVEVESPRQVGSREAFRPSLMSKMVTSSMISKPLEETKKSLLHLEALKDSLKKNVTRESLLAPFLVRQEPQAPQRTNLRDSPRPREVRTAVKVKEAKPRRIVIRRQDPPPTATKQKGRSNSNGKNRSRSKGKEKVAATMGSTETIEEEVKSVTSTSTGTSASGEDTTTDEEQRSSRVDKKSSKEKNEKKKSEEKPKVAVVRAAAAEVSSAVVDEGPCKRCRNLEAREHRRINDLMTENKSLTFMLGQKRSLVLSLQHQVKVLLNENQKAGLRLMMSKKKVEKLEKLSQKAPLPPPPPPATPVALLPSTPAELESKIHALTSDLRSLQLSHESTSSFLSSLLCTLNSRGYESLTDPQGNTIDLSKCCGDVTLEMKGRDPRLKVSGGGGGGGDSPRPRRIASGQELMLKSVIGSQEEFIRKMSIQFQDLHRANFIRGLVREDEEVADGVLNLLECAVRQCPAVVPVMQEQLSSSSSPRNSRLMAKILQRLGGMREAKFTPTVAACGGEGDEGTGTTGLLGRKEKMMRSTSGLDNQPRSEEGEEGRSRKCLEDEEKAEDCPGEWKDVMSSGDEVPQETKET